MCRRWVRWFIDKQDIRSLLFFLIIIEREGRLQDSTFAVVFGPLGFVFFSFVSGFWVVLFLLSCQYPHVLRGGEWFDGWWMIDGWIALLYWWQRDTRYPDFFVLAINTIWVDSSFCEWFDVCEGFLVCVGVVEAFEDMVWEEALGFEQAYIRGSRHTFEDEKFACMRLLIGGDLDDWGSSRLRQQVSLVKAGIDNSSNSAIHTNPSTSSPPAKALDQRWEEERGETNGRWNNWQVGGHTTQMEGGIYELRGESAWETTYTESERGSPITACPLRIKALGPG